MSLNYYLLICSFSFSTILTLGVITYYIILINLVLYMSLDQLKRFLKEMQNDESLKNEVLSSSTADDVALIALKKGYEFSGDELLRFSGKKVGRVTVQKNDVPGEYN